jgi:3-oxoacyl-[acyl-carrier-protein] synthase II
MRRQAVITGLGIVSPIGIGIDAFWASARAGRSGIGYPTLFDASKLPRECQIVGEVADFNVRDWMPGAAGRMAGRFSQFAVAAAKMARDDSRLDTAGVSVEKLKVSIGTSLNGQIDVAQTNFVAFMQGDTISPWASNEYSGHAATSHVAISAGARGQTTTFSTACAAGLDAIAWAAEQVQTGEATAVVAGATEAPLSEFILMVFQSVGVLSRWQGPPEEASRPFEQLRAGLVLAEGAAVVIVEDEEHARSRGARIYARILGYSSANEGAHLRKVDETGEAVARAMTKALDRARIQASDIDFVCAHGNSMRDYDAAETAGIKKAFGGHAWNIPISSLKSMCGQALAASSAMQVVASCLALRDQLATPTINYRIPDPACDLDYVPNIARRVRIRRVLIHAHSLGGSHVAMILGTPD